MSSLNNLLCNGDVCSDERVAVGLLILFVNLRMRLHDASLMLPLS
jgi:hypothetical protein